MKVFAIQSFPKSGNTWLRHIFAAAFNVRTSQVHEFLPDVHTHQILERHLSVGDRRIYFYKTHLCREMKNYRGKPFSNDYIFYIKRHPLDVFVSFVNYMSNSVTGDSESAGFLFDYAGADEIKGTEQMDILFDSFLLYGTLMPRAVDFGSWFSSVEYFEDAAKVDPRVKVITYESLYHSFDGQVSSLLELIGLTNVDISKLRTTVENSTKANDQFFWKRKANNYLTYLTTEQIRRFKRIHGDRAARLGYQIDEA